MRSMRLPALAAATAALAICFGPVAASGPASGVQFAQQQQSFSEAELKQYASAVIEVRRINQEYRPQLESAGSSDERMALQSEAVEEMTAAVNDIGLSVETYNQIFNAAQADPQLADKIGEYVREAK